MLIDYKQLLANKFPGQEIKFVTYCLQESGHPESEYPCLETYIHIDGSVVYCIDTHTQIGALQEAREREQQASKSYLLELEIRVKEREKNN